MSSNKLMQVLLLSNPWVWKRNESERFHPLPRQAILSHCYHYRDALNVREGQGPSNGQNNVVIPLLNVR